MTMFSGNTARLGGAIYVENATLNVTGSSFTGNGTYDSTDGGAILTSDSTASVSNSSFESNAGSEGAAIEVTGGTLTVTSSTFYDNRGNHGGAFCIMPGSVVAIDKSIIDQNQVNFLGGGIYNDNANLTLSNSTVWKNVANSLGGGIGKTQLALAVAQRLGDVYPDQLMFELQPGAEPLTSETLLGRVIHAFQPELKLPDALEELQGLNRGLLNGRRGLLLLDNAAHGGQVRPHLPPPAGWAIVVTSRSKFRLEGGKLHEVELLSPEDATALLARMLSDGGRPDLAGADLGPLAEQCGRLPLALRLAAGYLTSTNRPLPTYLDDLARARLKYLKDPEDERTVRAVLGLSVDRLKGESETLARRWRDLAVLPAPFDAAAAAAVWELGPDDAQEALDRLCQQSLVECEAGQYSWILGLQNALAGDFRRAAELMQVRVDYEQEIGHLDAQAHAETVADIRRRAGKRSRRFWPFR